jgi:hypothetical protein
LRWNFPLTSHLKRGLKRSRSLAIIALFTRADRLDAPKRITKSNAEHNGNKMPKYQAK